MSKVRYKSLWTVGLLMISQQVLVQGLNFSDANDPNVKFELRQSEKYAFLYMEENVESATLFNIENVNGKGLTLKYDDEKHICSDFDLNYHFQKKDEKNWALHIDTPLDYEQKNCPTIEAQITDQSDSYSFKLSLINLNDNDPQLKLQSKCQMQENTPYNKENSTCKVTMTDADGMMENTKFTISTNYQDTFNASFVTVPKTQDKEAEVVVHLIDGKTLDFENINLYIFSLTATEDIRSNDVQVIVNVKDMPDEPPKWTTMFTTKQFEENVDQEFNVKAVDGDVQINSTIEYKISQNGCSKSSCVIQIDQLGKITVEKVDREDVGDTVSLTIDAIEKDDGNKSSLDITFFVQDQDDNIPKIIIGDDKDNGTVVFEKDENFLGTITTFTVEDGDLADNGTFDIKLDIKKGSVDYTKAFQVIPVSGYQKGDFSLTVFNSSKLDYENDDWKVITFELQAIERANSAHIHSKTIVINLQDVNDEPPIFVNEANSVSVLESIEQGKEIFNAEARDKDANDVVTYQIVGVWSKKLKIDDNGIISTSMDKVFDYEQLQQVVIQIKATDNDEVHTTYKTLTIDVIDVDDETPSISVGRNRVTIKENSPAPTKLEDAEIAATDPDTKPKLKLEIDWSKSYITKNSATVNDYDDWQCFDLDPDDHDENAQKITAKLSINENCSPDFEHFDAVMIALKAIDENTALGDNFTTGSILVNIEDVNDNPPVFLKDSLKNLETTDGTEGVAIIGIVSATDADIHDNITFSIQPVTSDADWVDINEKTGQLTVKKGVTVDDDIPPRSSISYIITACDNDHTHCPNVTVDIKLKDINDQTPKITKLKNDEITIQEEIHDGDVIDLKAIDYDRDDPFNRVVFRFDTTISDGANNCFNITEKGKITVALRNGARLDRDCPNCPDTFILPILAYDNPTGSLQLKDQCDLKLVLEDINDNKPVIKTKSIECSEKLEKNDVLPSIVAEDIDEKGPNSDIKFDIKKVVPLSGQNPSLMASDFKISTTDNKTATITLLKDLEGHYGKYNITIETSDYGTPKLQETNNVELTVTKWNFKEPKFVFPLDNSNFILTQEQNINSNASLKLYGGNSLEDLEVDDLQNHKWEVTFKISGADDGPKGPIFSIISVNSWKARLQVTRNPTDEDAEVTHNITIEASVKNDQQDGEKKTWVRTNIKIHFFSTTQQPTFKDKDCKIQFQENSLGSPASIPKATYSSDVDAKPFYILRDYTDIFKVDQNEGDVSLRKELDYEETPSYEIKIVASNDTTIAGTPTADSTLTCKIDVIDMNDHQPEFHPKQFYGAFLKSFTTQSTIVTVTATDEDPRDADNLHFSLDKSITCYGLQPPSPPFIIDPSNGRITPEFTINSDMSGYCTFFVYVQDQKDDAGVQHTISTTVQINIIGDDELVQFIFLNPDAIIDQEQEKITAILDGVLKKYGYKSYLADRTFNKDYANTTAHFFFLEGEKQIPVKATEILGNLTEPEKFTTLKKELGAISVFLENFPADSTKFKQVEDYLKIWLLVSTIVLASMLMLLSIAFFFRNKALSQRIKNLSTTKFGSQESGLNRAGVAAPTTNRNAIEGSNPVFNSENYVKEVEPDRNSIISSDSDLFGVENNPEFEI